MSPSLLKKIAIFAGVILWSSANMTAEDYPKYDQRGNLSENYSSQGLRFYLTSDRSRYYTGNSIPLDCHIKNEGFYPITIYLDNDILKNFTIIVRDQKGESLPLKPTFGKSRKQRMHNENFFSNYTATDYNARAVVLEPGESISRSFNIPDLVILNLKSGANSFNVMAYFYPNPDQSTHYYIRSNNEYAFIVDSEAYKSNQYYAENSLHEKALRVSPKEIVFLMLSAEYDKQWLDYFKYIDLHEVIRDYPEHARQYVRAPQDKKSMIIEDFKKYLMGNARHQLIKFEVTDEIVDSSQATVKVKAMRKIDGFDRDFLYTYYLSAKDNLWQVTGVESQLVK